MICEDKKTNDNWKISGISPATICCRWFCPPLHLTPVWLNYPFPIITQKLSKIFSNTERRKLCSVRDRSWITTAVNVQGENTVVAGQAGRAYLLRCTSFPFYDCIPNTTEKGDGFFRFQTNTGGQVLQRISSESSISFLLSVYGLAKFSYSCNAFPHFVFYFDYMALHSLVSLLSDRSRKPPFFVAESNKCTLLFFFFKNW